MALETGPGIAHAIQTKNPSFGSNEPESYQQTVEKIDLLAGGSLGNRPQMAEAIVHGTGFGPFCTGGLFSSF
ncbi:hypothetical protein NUU61_008855 [Penicillium alfredii]|uniref:Uncharacterized protein n=1 Tax=Penicillium alfredii TaxID=1506179 RepID=A0A9W9EM20_9EURO|nr:uncharacterized protein NUU61_008855 [Penicillium alfredii]KAJ5084276.1 hypothetical protein NUU61_008855 [Penicillium alfredii]